MTKRATSWLGSVMTIFIIAARPTFPESPAHIVQPNDNRTPAGRMDGATLHVDLVAESGTWYPEGEHNPGLEIQAFREAGKPLQVPGPLLRVAVGTELVASVRNAVQGTTLELHGLQARTGDNREQVLTIPFGETERVRFKAQTPGTYFYWATTAGVPLNRRSGVDSQLSGALIVDPAGPLEPDRIFVLGEWLDPESPTPLAAERTAYVINGLAWPHTERMHLRMEERVRWRWINPSRGGHPMHLHGSFYEILSRGSLFENTEFDVGERPSVVTERLRPGSTMVMEWSPEHEGNWLMHCHIVGHVSPKTRLAPRSHAAGAHSNHAFEGMSGMVLGMHVSPAEANGGVVDPRVEPRTMTMHLERREGHYGENPGFGVSFQESGAPESPAVVPGPPLILTRGQPVAIDLINNLGEPTSVHWHGMELESYYDGVAGFGGTVTSVTPSVKPGDTFTVRFTPPRAGTFIYHTHMDDQRQLEAGLYGAMVITDPDEPFDPEVDKVFVIGLLGFGRPENIGINGEKRLRLTLERDVTYRLRIINITANNSAFNVTLTSRAKAVKWHPLAKDGAGLIAAERAPRPANRQPVSVGETFDFGWTPTTPGPHWLEVRRGGGEWMAQARIDVR